MKTSDYAQGVAETIFQQLGGNAFAVMTGANNFQFGTEEKGDFLRFTLPRAANNIKYVQIIYDLGFDWYIFKFLKDDGDLIEEIEMVYADVMHKLFEDRTGLLTSL